MTEHYVTVCKHGIQVSQCRCAASNKSTLLGVCPTGHAQWTEKDHPSIYSDGIGRVGRPVIPLTKTDPADERASLVALIKRISPIKHEPLATIVANEWADEFQREGWHL